MDASRMSTGTPRLFDQNVRSKFVQALRIACDAARVGAELYDADGTLLLDCCRIGIDTPELWTAAESDETWRSALERARNQTVARAVEWSQPYLYDVAPGVTEAVIPLFAADDCLAYVRVGPVRAAETAALEPGHQPEGVAAFVPGADRLPRTTIHRFRSFLDLIARAVQPCLSSLPPAARQEPIPVEPAVRPRGKPRVPRPRAGLLARDLFVMARYGRVRNAVRAYSRERLTGDTLSEGTRSRILSDILEIAESCAQAGVPSAQLARWINTATARAAAAADCATVERVIGELLGCVRRSGRAASPFHAARVRRVARYVETHLGEPLSAGDAARSLGLTPRRIGDTVKAQTGISYGTFVRVVRMGRARDLLDGTRLSVAEIARRLGYKYESHFSRVFAQHVGEPPTRFRQRVQTGATRPGRRTARR